VLLQGTLAAVADEDDVADLLVVPGLLFSVDMEHDEGAVGMSGSVEARQLSMRIGSADSRSHSSRMWVGWSNSRPQLSATMGGVEVEVVLSVIPTRSSGEAAVVMEEAAVVEDTVSMEIDAPM
jgi:hypothetical protein